MLVTSRMGYSILCIIAEYNNTSLLKVLARMLPELLEHWHLIPSYILSSAKSPPKDHQLIVTDDIEQLCAERRWPSFIDSKYTFMCPQDRKLQTLPKGFFMLLHQVAKETNSQLSVYKLCTFGGEVEEEWAWCADNDKTKVIAGKGCIGPQVVSVVQHVLGIHGLEMSSDSFEPFMRGFEWEKYKVDDNVIASAKKKYKD